MATAVDTTIREQALSWPEKARAAAVTDPSSYQSAGELLLGIKALRKQIDATFDPIIADAHKAHKTAVDQKRQVEAPLTEAETILKRALVAYDQEQERLRREEQRRLEEAARQRAEAEALERAAALEREGREFGDASCLEEAEAIVEQALTAPPPPIAPVEKATPKVAGIAMRTDWSCQCVSLIELVKFVATHPQHVNLLQFNQTAGNQLARAMREQLRIPGVRAVPTQRVAAGR